MIYSIPYILLIIIFGCIAIYYQTIDNKEIRQYLIAGCFIIYLFFFGFRGFIGTDWTGYYPAFDSCSSSYLYINPFTMIDGWRIEPGFTLLMFLSKSILPSYDFFIFICCLINEILLFKFLSKRTDNIPLTLIIFLCMGGFIMQVNLLRNSIAILLFINSLEYIEKKEPIKYYSICVLAISMHLSALLFLPLYFILNHKCNKWVYLVIFAIGNAILLLHIKTITPVLSMIVGEDKIAKMLDAYTQGVYEDANFKISIGYIERLLTGTLVFLYYDKLIEIREDNKLFINSFIAYISMFFFLSEFSVMSERMANLFSYSYWILWPDLMKCFNFKNNKNLFIAFISIYSIFKIIGMTSSQELEYDNIIFGAQSYQERLYQYNRMPN